MVRRKNGSRELFWFIGYPFDVATGRQRFSLGVKEMMVSPRARAGHANGSLFKDFNRWPERKPRRAHRLVWAPLDEDLMRTFRPQERDYRRGREAEAEQLSQIAAYGDIPRALRRATSVAPRERQGGFLWYETFGKHRSSKFRADPAVFVHKTLSHSEG